MTKFFVLTTIAVFAYGLTSWRLEEVWKIGVFAALYWTVMYGIAYYQIKIIMRLSFRKKKGVR